MQDLSPEISLLLLLTADIYKRPKLQWPKWVHWNRFLRLCSENKMLYYALIKILEDDNIKTRSEVRNLLRMLKENEEKNILRLQRTIGALNMLLGSGNYLLLNTYKFYPYATHDVDILVNNLRKTEKILRSNGFRLFKQLLPGVHYVKEGLLLIDIFDKIAWGGVDVVDDDLAWSGNRMVTMGGLKVRLPNLEADLLSIVAHILFQFYQITLCDLLYLYRIAPRANWPLITRQASKYRWLGALHDTIYILNYFHQRLYEKTCPIEKYIQGVKQSDLDLPYILSINHVARALAEKGLKNLPRLVSYTADGLKKYSFGLHMAYTKVILDYLSRYWVKYIYW